MIHTLISYDKNTWHRIDSYIIPLQQLHLWSITLPEQQKKPQYEVLHQQKQERLLLLKRILGFYLSQELDLDYTSHGKPYLRNHTLEFNLSHSLNHLFIAIHTKPLGLDIEILKSRPLEHFSRRFFGDSWFEQALEPYPDYLKLLGFFQAWTQTEAWIKAHAETVFQYSAFKPEAFPLGQAKRIHPEWQMLSFMPRVGVICSVCCAPDVDSIHEQNLDLSQIDHYNTFIYEQNSL